MRARRNARLASVALLGGMLAVGFLAGMAWRTDGEPAASAPGAREDRGGRPGRLLVIDQLGLGAEQRAQVQTVIRHFRSRMRALDEEVRDAYEPRQRALVREARDSIKSLLSPDQRSAYDSLLAARHSRRGGEPKKRGAGESRGGT